ncbi:MAG: response regulator transcription factor [Syntrophomonadaceae bacterium]
MRVLLVEDETRLAEALAYILKKNKYAVDLAFDGISGEELAETGIYDLIILDRMLPGKEGIAVLESLRAGGLKTPVLILTARDAIEDRVAGLNAGADDYLVKPFATEELLARLSALARRAPELLNKGKLQVGRLTLEPMRCEVTYGPTTIKLTLKEAQLLEYLIKNRGQVLSREQLLSRVWGLDTEVEINIVEIYIHYLRKKLDPEKSGVQIETVRGIGYCLKEG